MNALADYAARFESAAPDIQVAVRLGGEEIGTAAFASVRDAPVTVARGVGAGDRGASSTLEIARSGTGRLYYAARMRYATASEARDAVNAGIDIRREYSVERDGRWALLGNPARVQGAIQPHHEDRRRFGGPFNVDLGQRYVAQGLGERLE